MQSIEYSYERIKHTAQLLKEDGFGFRGTKIDFQSYMSLEPQEAADLLRGRLSHLITGLRILDTDNQWGVFNRHDQPHLEHVYELTHTLLDRAAALDNIQTTKEEHNVATAIIFLHDLGNNINRKNHGVISVALFDKIFAGFDANDPFVKSIKRGILLHDEHTGTDIEDFSKLREDDPDLLVRPIWSLIIADKLDISRYRISNSVGERMPATFSEIVEKTPHTLVLLYAQHTNLDLLSNGHAIFTIDFSTAVENERDEHTKAILNRFIWKNSDMYVPHAWHENWRDHDIPYSVSYLGNLRSLYVLRFSMMLSCLFALFPSIQTFQISIRDTKTYIDTEITSFYSRDTWQEVQFMIWKKVNREKYKAGAIATPLILQKGKLSYMERQGYTT